MSSFNLFQDATLEQDLLRTLCRIANQGNHFPWSDAAPAKARILINFLETKRLGLLTDCYALERGLSEAVHRVNSKTLSILTISAAVDSTHTESADSGTFSFCECGTQMNEEGCPECMAHIERRIQENQWMADYAGNPEVAA